MTAYSPDLRTLSIIRVSVVSRWLLSLTPMDIGDLSIHARIIKSIYRLCRLCTGFAPKTASFPRILADANCAGQFNRPSTVFCGRYDAHSLKPTPSSPRQHQGSTTSPLRHFATSPLRIFLGRSDGTLGHLTNRFAKSLTADNNLKIRNPETVAWKIIACLPRNRNP